MEYLLTNYCHGGYYLFFTWSSDCRNGVHGKLPLERPKIMLIFSLWVGIGMGSQTILMIFILQNCEVNVQYP